MLYRKIQRVIEGSLSAPSDKVLLVCGARQVGKSYIIRYVGQKIFKNFVEINLIEDFEGNGLFRNVKTTDDFYFALSSLAGLKLGNSDDTLVFLDEIQQYPHLFTLLKFLRQENRFRYAASGSLPGVSLKTTTSIPIGSIEIVEMFPLDFEEFIRANGVGTEAIERFRGYFVRRETLPAALHDHLLGLFKRYLLIGGLPEAVNTFLETRNIVKVRGIQRDIHKLYIADASKYDELHRLNIKRLYELLPSNMENKKKRIVYKDIEDKPSSRASDYSQEMEYLVSAGTALEVKAISNPKFPLIESEHKTLVKLYLNDVGLLTGILYRYNVQPVLDDQDSINLGSVYESVVAQELCAHGNKLFYYDNRTRGEVDYLIDDYRTLSVVPIEVKSGKDYKRHSALSRFVDTDDYHIKQGFVLSNSSEVETQGKVTYLPIYHIMFLGDNDWPEEQILL